MTNLHSSSERVKFELSKGFSFILFEPAGATEAPKARVSGSIDFSEKKLLMIFLIKRERINPK